MEEKGRRSLRAVLTCLRSRLPDGAIGGKGQGRLWLEESVVSPDVRRFERVLDESRPRLALRLYRGPVLEHFHLSGLRPFNRWEEERREHYRRRAYRAALTAAEDVREAGQLGEAEQLYRRAVERDSTFAPAWGSLAQALVIYPERRDNDPDSVFPMGQEAARRALRLDADLAEAHAALSIVDFYRMRLPLALRRMKRAVELEPSLALGHHGLNLIHLVLGRPDEALEYARCAVALSPLKPQNQIGLALAASAAGDHQLALEAARAGDPEPARTLLARFEDSLDRPIMPIGVLQAALGRREAALETFRGVFRRQETSGGGTTIRLRYLYPDVLGPLRQASRWDELIREVNVAWGLKPDGSLPGGG